MDWHFVPRVNDNGPFATVICLIWAPSLELSANLQKGVALEVSKLKYNMKNEIQHLVHDF